MNQRQRQRRTLGSGPPPDLLFGELAYSDADGLLHCGRPDGTVRSYGQSIPPTWATLQGKPSTYPPSAHTHDYAAAPLTGTWNPGYRFSVSGSATMDPLSMGQWRKVGNWVEFHLRVRTQSLTAPQGSVRINLPPFAADAPPFWPCVIGAAAAWSSAVPRLSALIVEPTELRLYENPMQSAYALLDSTRMNPAPGGNDLFIVGAYRSL